MTKYIDPQQEYRNTMAQISDPMKSIRESLGIASDPLKAHREAMEQISDPMKSIRESLGIASDPLKAHREAMEQISDPMKSIRESLGLASDPLKAHREAMEQISDPMKSIRESMALAVGAIKIPANPISALMNLEKHLQPLNVIKDFALNASNDICIDDFGQISLSSKRIAVTELQNISNEVFVNSAKGLSNLEDILNNLISEIKKQNDPLTQKVLMWFVYPLIVGLCLAFINPVVGNYVKGKITSNKREVAKELKVQAKASINDLSALTSLRYVSADILNVRSGPSNKSDLIGSLRFSSAVLVIKKQKSWTLIEWRDSENDVFIKGWVFSRYLSKFN